MRFTSMRCSWWRSAHVVPRLNLLDAQPLCWAFFCLPQMQQILQKEG